MAHSQVSEALHVLQNRAGGSWWQVGDQRGEARSASGAWWWVRYAMRFQFGGPGAGRGDSVTQAADECLRIVETWCISACEYK